LDIQNNNFGYSKINIYFGCQKFLFWISEIVISDYLEFFFSYQVKLPWELLYADDLVVIADSLEECISKLRVWKAGMESKGLRVSI